MIHGRCFLLYLVGCVLVEAFSCSNTLLNRSSLLQHTFGLKQDGTIHRRSMDIAASVLSSTRGGGIILHSKSKDSNKDDHDDGGVDKNEISEMETDESGDDDGDDLVVKSSFEKVSVDARAREQAGQSYFLSSLLWLSLAFDVLLNKSKRLALFGQGQIQLGNIVPTFHLAFGFLLASGTSYWLSHFMSSNENQKLPLVLFLFGILNLGAHTNPTQSFLGQGAAIINIHNALVSINEYWKQRKLSLLLIPNKTKQKPANHNRTSVFMTSKLAGLFTLVSVIPTLFSLPFMMPLQWTSCARRILLAGIAFNYNSIVGTNSNWQFGTLISLTLLGMALPMWMVMITKSLPVTISAIVPTLIYTLFAIVSGWDTVLAFRNQMQNEKKDTVPTTIPNI